MLFRWLKKTIKAEVTKAVDSAMLLVKCDKYGADVQRYQTQTEIQRVQKILHTLEVQIAEVQEKVEKLGLISAEQKLDRASLSYEVKNLTSVVRNVERFAKERFQALEIYLSIKGRPTDVILANSPVPTYIYERVSKRSSNPH